MLSNQNGNQRRAKIEIFWVLGVVLFTIARFVVAYSTLAKYGLNIWAFGLIDIVTAIPYGVGTARLVFALVDRRLVATLQWTCIAASAFLAPYIYVAFGGGPMPVAVYVVLAVLIVAFGGNAALSVRSKVRKARSEIASQTGMEIDNLSNSAADTAGE